MWLQLTKSYSVIQFFWNCMEIGPGKSFRNPVGGVAKRLADLSVKNKKTVIQDVGGFLHLASKVENPNDL